MRIRITKPGPLATIQDGGRKFYLDQAVPISGPMDPVSAKIANIALGNSPDSAVIEFTYDQAGFKAETDLLIAYSGGGSVLRTKTGDLPEGRPLFIPQGVQVDLAHYSIGARIYLAIAGSWDIPKVLASKSTYLPAGFGGQDGRKLKPGDELVSENNLSNTSFKLWNSLKGTKISYPAWSIPRPIPFFSSTNRLRIIRGRESTWFDELSLEDFYSLPFRVSNESNRMGFRLEGKKMQRKNFQELLSSAVLPGTIQVTGEGSLIILMADCQTTGGYPKIGQVSAVDLALCGQLKPGDEIFFDEISHKEAERDYIEVENEFDRIIQRITEKLLENRIISKNGGPKL